MVGLLGSVSSYFSSEWGFASFKFSDQTIVPVTKAAFIGENLVCLVSLSGDYYKLTVSDEAKTIEVTEQTKFYEQ